MKKIIWLLTFLIMFAFSGIAMAVVQYKPPGNNRGVIGNEQSGAAWRLFMGNRMEMEEISAPSGNPASNHGWIYVKDKSSTSALYFEDDGGSIVQLGTGATPSYDTVADPASDVTLVFADNYTEQVTYADTNEDMYTIQAIGAFTNVSVVVIEQKTGNASDGTLLELKLAAAETDPDFISFAIGGTEKFNVDAAGTITIAGVKAAGTTIDANSLDWIGAGEIKTASGSALTLAADDGGDSGEDLIITADNITLLATGALSITPNAGLTTAIDLTDSDLTNALSIGVNNIIGTTSTFTFNSWSISSGGAAIFTALDAGSGTIETTGDITAGGTITGATITQDEIIAVTGNTDLKLDGSATTGGVDIGTAGGNGVITMGGSGYATEVILASAVNLDIQGGDLTIVDTASSDLVQLTNNSMTSDDIIQISATGTRTSGNVIKITDGATAAEVILITANAITSGTFISLVTTESGFAGEYLKINDGSEIFTIEDEGVITIAGTIDIDSITLTAGDLQMTDGKLDMDDGMISLNSDEGDELNTFSTSFDLGNVGASTDYFTIANTVGAGNTAAISYLLSLEYAADGDAQDGYLKLSDNSAANVKFSIGAGATTTWTLDATSLVTLDAAATTNTQTSGILFVNVVSSTNGHVGVLLDYEVDDSGASTQYGFQTTLDDDGAGTNDTFVAYDAIISDGTDAVTVGFEADQYDSAFKATVATTGVVLEVDVAATYTAKGMDIDLGPWVGTVTQGFIDIFTDSAAIVQLGQIIRINIQNTSAPSTAISGKGIYLKDASAYKQDDYLLHVESDNSGAAYLDGEVDINLATSTDDVTIVSNATDNTSGAGVLTIYDDASGQDNTSYLLRLVREPAADAQNGFVLFEVDSTGAAGNGTDVFTVTYDGSIITAGDITGDGATVLSAVLQDSEDVVAANNDLAYTECGKVMFLNAGAGFQTTLPAISTVPSGCTFEFIVASTGANYTIITGNSTENILYGGVVERETDTNDDGPYQAAGDTMTFVNGQMVVGDYIKLISNGSVYYVIGQVNADGAFTIAQAS